MQFHLGPLGDLAALPPIERDQNVPATSSAPSATRRSLAGAPQQDRMGRPRGQWKLSWVYLEHPEYQLLEALRRGERGRRQWLVDPAEPNLAPGFVATPGDRRTARGWTTSSGVPPARGNVPDPPVRAPGTGVIRWNRSTTAADTLRTGATLTGWVPLLAGERAGVAAAVRCRNTGPVVVRPGLDLRAADGAVSTVLGDPVSVGTGWTDLVFGVDTSAVAFAAAWSIAAGQPAGELEIAAVREFWGPDAPAPSLGGGSARVQIDYDSFNVSHPEGDETVWNVSMTVGEV